jgi:hypothetical protein
VTNLFIARNQRMLSTELRLCTLYPHSTIHDLDAILHDLEIVFCSRLKINTAHDSRQNLPCLDLISSYYRVTTVLKTIAPIHSRPKNDKSSVRLTISFVSLTINLRQTRLTPDLVQINSRPSADTLAF